jgi:uncharacterized protein YndB with AHSA1/START domain
MTGRESNASLHEPRDFTLTRIVNAPRERVFRAFIEPAHMQQWWAPRGYRMLSCALNLHEGGTWRMRIQSEETGEILSEAGVYRTIRAPECLSFTHSWVRLDGTLTHATLVTVDFADRRGKTEISFHQTDFPSTAACRSHEEGWGSSLELLGEYIERSKAT